MFREDNQGGGVPHTVLIKAAKVIHEQWQTKILRAAWGWQRRGRNHRRAQFRFAGKGRLSKAKTQETLELRKGLFVGLEHTSSGNGQPVRAPQCSLSFTHMGESRATMPKW